jgi:hypothetical protein
VAGNEILGGLGLVRPGNQGANIGIFNWKNKGSGKLSATSGKHFSTIPILLNQQACCLPLKACR